MKKPMTIVLPLIAATALFASNAYATTGYGNCNYGKETVDSVVCYGAAVLDGTTVTGEVTVYGAATITNAVIKGATNIYGPFTTVNSTFNQNVFSATDALTLNKCTINGNLSEKSSLVKGLVTMKNSSCITGDVNFTGSSGVVKLDNSSSIAGSIINGKKVSTN